MSYPRTQKGKLKVTKEEFESKYDKQLRRLERKGRGHRHRWNSRNACTVCSANKIVLGQPR